MIRTQGTIQSDNQCKNLSPSLAEFAKEARNVFFHTGCPREGGRSIVNHLLSFCPLLTVLPPPLFPVCKRLIFIRVIEMLLCIC